MKTQIPETQNLPKLWQETVQHRTIHIHQEVLLHVLGTLEPSLSNITQRGWWYYFFELFQRIGCMTILLDILQNRKRFIQSIVRQEHLRQTSLALLFISIGSFFVYGFVLGLQHSVLQALSSAFKLPLLFIVTITITLPTLFIFGSFLGMNRTFQQTLTILLAGTTILSLALVAQAPITLLFGMTTSSYAFFKLLNVAIFMIAWFLGAAFFRAVYTTAPTIIAAELQSPEEQHPQSLAIEPAEEENRKKIQSYFIRFWFLLYGFVAVQIAWMLRPFVCTSSMEFEWFRGMRDNVYGDILYSIAHILGLR